jgi:hypothetical protein
MAWNDEIFRDRITHRALEIRKSQAQVLSEAGLSKGWLSAGNGRTVRTLERIMAPLGWTPRDLFQAMSAALGWDFNESKGVWISNEEINRLVATLTDKFNEEKRKAEWLTTVNADLQYRLGVANATLRYLQDHGPEETSVFVSRATAVSTAAVPLRGESSFGADAKVGKFVEGKFIEAKSPVGAGRLGEETPPDDEPKRTSRQEALYGKKQRA